MGETVLIEGWRAFAGRGGAGPLQAPFLPPGVERLGRLRAFGQRPQHQRPLGFQPPPGNAAVERRRPGDFVPHGRRRCVVETGRPHPPGQFADDPTLRAGLAAGRQRMSRAQPLHPPLQVGESAILFGKSNARQYHIGPLRQRRQESILHQQKVEGAQRPGVQRPVQIGAVADDIGRFQTPFTAAVGQFRQAHTGGGGNFRAPQFFQRPAVVGRVHPAVARQPAGEGAHIIGALFVGSPAHGIQPGARLAHIAGQQRQVHQHSYAIAAQAGRQIVQPIDHRRRRRLAEQPGRRADVGGGNIGGGAGVVQRQIVQGVVQRGRAFAVLLLPGVVFQPGVVQRLVQRAQQQQFGAGGRAQPHIGVAGQLRFPRVDDDELGGFAGGPLDGHAHHILLFGKVGIEHQNTAGLFQIPEGAGGGGIAQGRLQRLGQFRLAVGGLVDVVGTHHQPGEFLRQIMLFVGSGGRG